MRKTQLLRELRIIYMQLLRKEIPISLYEALVQDIYERGIEIIKQEKGLEFCLKTGIV